MRKPTKEQAKTIRAIAKVHGLKGCKAALNRVRVGQQGQWLPAATVRAFDKDLKAAGFYIEPMFLSNIDNDLNDTFLIYA